MKTTAHIEWLGGVPCLVPNEVIERPGEDFYISYNNRDRRIYGCDTTAIVVGNSCNFYILDGDHREQLAGKTLQECLDYFKENAALHNKYSEQLPEAIGRLSEAP